MNSTDESDSRYAGSFEKRFRGYLPVVVDVETGGFNAHTDALLEIAIVLLEMDEEGYLHRGTTHAHHVQPFDGANLEEKSLAVNRIDPYHPFRHAIPEKDALLSLFKQIRKAMKTNSCHRAILVGHNAFFDLGFINAAVRRCQIKRSPFHPFCSFDTVTLAGVAFGQTVLARAAQAADIEWNEEEAHSAIYDAERTADLFCRIVNRWQLCNSLVNADGTIDLMGRTGA